ncbi:hypothetical protein NC651_020776 [Populus alba x Populus x berolinensis]|nr:hypothetical protein NC651_020776 [Populus alba x Populus x berolinensis]
MEDDDLVLYCRSHSQMSCGFS